MLNKNPFLKEEILKSWFEEVESYNKSKKISLKNYLSKKSASKNSNFLNILKSFMVYNFTHFTKFSIIILAFIALITGGLTTQALAPENLKPSTAIENVKNKLFSANKQKDKDPYTALTPDEDNYVANLQECDLAFKFPKKVDGQEVVFERIGYEDSSNYVIYKTPRPQQFSGLSIACSNNIRVGNPLFVEQDITGYDVLTSKQLANETGWLISESTIDKYYYSKNYNSIFFTKENKNYLIQSSKDSGIAFNNIQLQFSSLVTNKFSDDFGVNTNELGCLKNIIVTSSKKELTTYSPQKTTDMEAINYKDKNSTDDDGFFNIQCKKQTEAEFLKPLEIYRIEEFQRFPDLDKRMGTYSEVNINEIKEFKVVDKNKKITKIISVYVMSDYQKNYNFITNDGFVYSISMLGFERIKNSYGLIITID